MNLIESYKNRLAIAESVHQKSHNGAKMSSSKKLMIASVLNNTSKFLSEAFNNASATQRGDIGDFKKFCLNISTVALPNLILPEIMLVQPMTSLSGYVTYLRYTAGTTKGGVENGRIFNDPYTLGTMDQDRMRYTSSAIAEKHKIIASEVSGTNVKFVLDWNPVLSVKSVELFSDAGELEKTLKIVTGNSPSDGEVAITNDGAVNINDSTATENKIVKIKYLYDNEIIPQENTPTSLPTLRAQMKGINLHAHARRIAVYYSQMSAFQAKNDFGMDLGQQLASQAQGELAYEIDTEGVLMLSNGAELDDSLVMTKYVNDKAISRSQYYEEFSEKIARGAAIIYNRTQKFSPNFMLIAADVLPIMGYLKGWQAAPAAQINGPYMAGTINGIKVYVSPAIPSGEYVLGVNGSDLQTSAAIYAPYMAIVPTQLLGFADGTMSQGFSTMYDMKLLSTYNRGSDGKIEEPKEDETGTFSYLLVKGKIEEAAGDYVTYLNVKLAE